MPSDRSSIIQEKQPCSKILVISDRYADTTRPVSSEDIFIGRDLPQELRLVEMFEEAGFQIIRGDVSEAMGNSLILGIHAKNYPDEYSRNRSLARQVDIAMPELIEIESVLQTSSPLVAKMLDSNRGQDKYLLHTHEDKLRFLMWLVLQDELSALAFHPNVNNYLIDVRSRIIDGSAILEAKEMDNLRWRRVSDYYFEEYIPTPYQYNTSLRLVADAFGQIHYSQLIRSPKRKGESRKQVQSFSDTPLRHATIPGTRTDLLLLNPNSPFYINADPFVSNHAQGGVRIPICGNPTISQTDIDVLRAHGIDPEKPRIPDYLGAIASQIGIESRLDYPYVGIDFIQ